MQIRNFVMIFALGMISIPAQAQCFNCGWRSVVSNIPYAASDIYRTKKQADSDRGWQGVEVHRIDAAAGVAHHQIDAQERQIDAQRDMENTRTAAEVHRQVTETG